MLNLIVNSTDAMPFLKHNIPVVTPQKTCLNHGQMVEERKIQTVDKVASRKRVVWW